MEITYNGPNNEIKPIQLLFSPFEMYLNTFKSPVTSQNDALWLYLMKTWKDNSGI